MNMDAFMASLNLMWMGMLAIFTVIVVIFIVTQVMLTISNRKKKVPQKNDGQ